MPPRPNSDLLRREKILNAAFEVVAGRSLQATRMRDVAAAAGVSPPSLHYYFNTKAQLSVALLDRLRERLGNGGASPAGDPPSRLRGLADQHKQLIVQARDQLEVYYDFWVQGTKQPEVRRKIGEMYANWRLDIDRIVAEGVRLGQWRADRAPLAAFLLVSLFQGAALQSIIDPEGFDLEVYFEQVGEFAAEFLSVVQPAPIAPGFGE